MSRVLLRWVETDNIENQFKILTYDGYWSRVMFYKSQKKLTHRQIWELMESDLSKLNTSAYISFISFETSLKRYVQKQKTITINPEDYDCRLFSYEGYWEIVMETKQEDYELTVEQVWKKIEKKLDRIGLGRYKTLSSFTTHYYNYINTKLKK